MKYHTIVKRIFLPIIFWAVVCPGISSDTLTATAATDTSVDAVTNDNTYSVTIGDGSSSVSLNDASVSVDDGHLNITLSPDHYQELASAMAAFTDTSTENFNLEAHTQADPVTLDLTDGEYSIELAMSGGSGKASVVSPTILTVENGHAYADITWSSSNYDYMVVAGETYLNESEDNMASSFHIPVTKVDEEMSVIADTTAMGTPHEVNYTFTFYSESIGSTSQMPQEASKRVVIMALIIIIGGGILNHYVNKKRKK